MEPTKNANLNTGMGGMSSSNGMNGANNEPSEPVFRGMPKPGQPLTSTPRVNATAPSTFVPGTPTAPSGIPTTTAQVSSTPFSAHSPSALDRLMNPSLTQNASVPPTQLPKQAPMTGSAPVPTPSAAQSTVPPSSSPLSSSSSTFKPYTPPSSPVSTQSTTSSAYSPTYGSASPVASVSPTSGYKVGTPTQYPSMQSASTSASALQSSGPSSNSYSNGIPAAPSATVTAAKLGNEVNAILSNQQKAPKSHKGTLVLIISMIIVLLLLAGGGYYWYTYMYLPNKENTSETTKNPAEDLYNQTNTTNNNSAFPTAVTKPAAVTQPVTTPVKATSTKTPPKVTRVTTPFNQSQRDIVSSYIYANINKIASPKSNVPYEVTDVTFDGPDRAVVQYTNGNNSYTAVAVASIDTADNVRIVSFSLLEK